ncbi:MAG: ComEC/Rec2 family competence protein [Candidatus Kapaibacterium sp.]|nr:MAG: ComEC/Rec2 family competence protein [Candidatus Kapabacteria bacterium]
MRFGKRPCISSFFTFSFPSVKPAPPSTQLPALKLLCGGGVGCVAMFLAHSFLPSTLEFKTVFSLSREIFLERLIIACSCVCLVLCVAALLRKNNTQDSSRFLQTIAYWNASICAGLLMMLSALGTEKSTTPSKRFSALQPTMNATLHGTILRVLRCDSLPHAVQFRLLVRGNLDAVPLPRRFDETILLTLRFPAPRTARDSARAPYALLPRDIRAGSRIYAVLRARLPQTPILPNERDEQFFANALEAAWIAEADAQHCASLGETHRLWNFTEYTAEWTQKRINALFPASTSRFAFALLTGNTHVLDTETRQQYARTGTAHILAVSGLHLAVVAAILLLLLGFIRSKAAQILVFSLSIAAFVLATGAAASAVRAGMMAVVLMFLQNVERRAHLLNVLAFCVLVLVAVQPSMLFSVGFQMSCAAVLGIVVVLPRCTEFCEMLVRGRPAPMRFRRSYPVRALEQSLGVSVAASCVIAPIVAWYFGIFSVISPFANLLIVPISSLAMLYTMASVVLASLWWQGGVFLAQTAHQCLLLMNWLNGFFAELHGAYLEGAPQLGSAFFVATAFSFLTIYVVGSVSPRHALFRVAVSLASVILCALGGIEYFSQPQKAECVLYPRPRTSLVVTRFSGTRSGTSVLLLNDRRCFADNEFIPRDPALTRFVRTSIFPTTDTLLCCASGSASMLAFADILQEWHREKNTTRNHVPHNVVLMASTLRFRGKQWFRALDSVQAIMRDSAYSAPHLHFANAEKYWQQHERLLLGVVRHSPPRPESAPNHDSTRFWWNAWSNTLEREEFSVSSTLPKRSSILIPRCVQPLRVKE